MTHKARLTRLEKLAPSREKENPVFLMRPSEIIARAQARIAEVRAAKPESEYNEHDLYILSFEPRIEATAQALRLGKYDK